MGQRWLSGLAWQEERRATSDEVRELDALTRKLRTARAVGMPITLATLALGLLLLFTGSEGGILLGLGALIASLPLGLWWFEGLRFADSLRLDLPEPLIDVFIAQEDTPPESLERELNPSRRIEVLRASNLVWKCDGVRVSPLRKASVDEASSVPDHSAIVAGWMRNQDRYPDEPTYRDLSPQELEEIRRAASSIVKGILFFGALGLYIAAVIIRVIAGFLIGEYTMYLFSVAAVGLLLSLYIAKYVRLAVKLHDDANFGAAVVVAADEPIEKLKVARQDIIEILPHSGLVWMVEAKPANWRRKF